MVDTEGCDNVSDRFYVQTEQDRPKNKTLRYFELDGSWNRLLVANPRELEPLCQIILDPILCMTTDYECEPQFMQERACINHIEHDSCLLVYAWE